MYYYRSAKKKKIKKNGKWQNQNQKKGVQKGVQNLNQSETNIPSKSSIVFKRPLTLQWSVSFTIGGGIEINPDARVVCREKNSLASDFSMSLR